MGEAKMHTYPVVRVVEHGPFLKSFYFQKHFHAEPGQFVNLWIPGVDEKPFSISDMDGELMELSVKAVGPFSRKLMEAKVGDWLGIRGPFGKGFSLERDSIVVGGGIGIAPLRFLRRRLEEKGLKHRVLWGLRTKADLIFPEELGRGAELMSEDGSVGGKGLVTERLEQMLERERPQLIYGAGPEPMLLAVLRIAEQRGIPYQLSFERYMKCGIGICGQCCMDGSGIRLCVEGPVLGPSEVAEVTDLGEPHRIASGRRSLQNRN
jgi:dihydroorotate dehydrogenase electron transfer subunit